MKKEISCGACVYDNEGRVLIIKHVLGHTDIPKGHIEKGETKEETAIREIKEETGIDIELDKRIEPIMITYSPKKGITKDVYYFTGYALNDNIKVQEEEVESAKFIDPLRALKILTYDNAKSVLKYSLDKLNSVK